MPQWNLHLILSALLWPPFSDGAVDRPSDDVIGQKWRTLKTTLLLLLATNRRRSYLELMVICMLYVCQPASSYGDLCRISLLSISYHMLVFWLRTRCLIRLSSGYVFLASFISTQMSRRECCVGKVMWRHHLVCRCGYTCDQWTLFHSAWDKFCLGGLAEGAKATTVLWRYQGHVSM